VAAAVMAALAGLGTLVVHGEGTAAAIWSSAALAFVVQLAGFAFASALQPVNVMAGWGAGMVLRFGSLVAYAFAVKSFGLPVAVSLVSYAGFLFVSTLIEPLFLKP
jgi:hypothetical protein